MAKYRKLSRTSGPEKSITEKPGNKAFISWEKSLLQKLKQKEIRKIAEAL